VDGHNLANYGLSDVRKAISIIPQDPVLFTGTVRFNLDPFSEYSDKEIWDAIDRAHLRALVSDPIRNYFMNLLFSFVDRKFASEIGISSCRTWREF
jgi:ABC-type multidrug transport system fused ATPase/permease subunit